MNVMKNIKIGKVTLNIGAGKDQRILEKGLKLLEKLSSVKPVKTVTQKRIPGWGLRPGLPIGCKVTIRDEDAKKIVPRLLDAKSNALELSHFDNNGSVSFGIHEYIDISGIEYDPEIGIIGLQVCITLERPGYRVKKRRLLRSKISKNHNIKKEEAQEYLKKEFNVKIGEEA